MHARLAEQHDHTSSLKGWQPRERTPFNTNWCLERRLDTHEERMCLWEQHRRNTYAFETFTLGIHRALFVWDAKTIDESVITTTP